MSIDVRQFRAADGEHVRRLAERLTEGVASWRDDRAVARAVQGWIDASSSTDFEGAAFVATDDGDVVGFLSLSTTKHFGGELDAYIGELVVDPAAEGRGVGGELVAAAERRARADGHRCITLTTGAANARALGFYRRLGYRDEAVELTKVLTD